LHAISIHDREEPMSVASAWAAYCRATAATPLPASVEARARLCLADHLHAAIHGAGSDTGKLLRSYLDRDGAAGDPWANAEAAALYAGAISAVHEIDDVQQDTSLHPGSVVVAAALGAAGENDVPGSRLLAAIVAGYEVAVRLSVAAGHRHYHYFHSTATCGTLGAAAAASIVYGLDEGETAHAFGMAATSASGLWEDINDDAVTVKHLHPGQAAERGVRAAKLARHGLRSARHAIEGDKGFLAALARAGAHAPGESPTPEELAPILMRGLGERPAIMRNIFKRYPFCLGCFEPLEGIRKILAAPMRSASDITGVRVETSTSTAWMVGQSDPHDEFQAKFSAPYALALVLAGHDVERAPLPARLLDEPDVRRWIPFIRVEGNAEFRRRRARVTASLSDGTQESADEPFRNLGDDEVRARFARASGEALGERGSTLEQAVDRCASLSSVAELMPLARAATRG
jgi:2-methylcitrate dehydratase PrpD